jgi:hypothetical protein
MYDSAPSASALLAAATERLSAADAGFKVVERDIRSGWPTEHVRVFEDLLSVVAVVVFETWHELSSHWADAQAALVELMTEYFLTFEAKAWDGYLVVLTPGNAGVQFGEVEQIRYDVSQVRKLVADGSELATTKDLERLLAPLLPLTRVSVGATGPASVLEALMADLVGGGVDEAAIRAVVSAFENDQPLMDALHRYRTASR